MVKYEGTIMGFHYKIEKSTQADFDTWLQAKLTKYLLNAEEMKALKIFLGITDLENRIAILEDK